jgi:hypothetical protein
MRATHPNRTGPHIPHHSPSRHRSSARPAAGIRLAGAAPTATTRITFVLVNDTYLMADEVMADGKRRGGFARLAAVVLPHSRWSKWNK